MAILIFRPFFVALLFVAGVLAAQNSDDVRTFIENNRHNKAALNEDIAPSWVSSPKVRGTGDIIISCLVTLIACAYTAIHPTVPPEGSGERSFMGIKAALVFVAVLGPEAVFALAFQEYLDARRLYKSLKEIIHDPKKQGNPCGHCNRCDKCDACEKREALETLDMKFCYFIVMGGLQVSISDIKPSDYVRYNFHGDKIPETLPLSADGVIELAKLGYLDKLLVKPTVIEDKSKGAWAQKCVVVIQVAWMGISCIARKAAGYPVSLLELHTFGHVLVAMLLYMFWLKKPLDVRQPVFVEPSEFKDKRDTEGFQDALALMVQEQFCDLQNQCGFLNLKWKQEELDAQNVANTEGNGEKHTKQTEPQIIDRTNQTSTPSSTPGREPQVFIEVQPEPYTTFTQQPGPTLPIKEVHPSNDPETFDLPVDQYLPCGLGHMPMSEKPTWRCMRNGPDNWRRNLKRNYSTERSEQDRLPIGLTRADRCRAERAVRHIKVVEKLYNIQSVEQPEPYAYQRYGSTGNYYRYRNLGYKTGFQSLMFELDKLNPMAARRKITVHHIRDTEEAKPRKIDAHRQKLCDEGCPRVIMRYAAFLDAIFNGIGRVSRLVCIVVSALIGAIHLAAWDSVFPTKVESIIWKTSGITMMATVPAVLWYRFQVVMIRRYHFHFHLLGYRMTYLRFIQFLNIWYFFIAIACLLFIIVIGAYFIVESFISVRHMPYGTYYVPDWLQVFPHI
ncbi:hypothetical protein B0T20DRAFT_208195 [Sordaria brevicollis]|uniref:Uncharacterized protein n=1 Tax=Sordaria brevicollis TaxID=83679 RepID=A0AAE0UC82_SORBR|nr:hypothetical protein B0T20DRAFT_208195 [Sordaria brevicollis]